MRRRMANNSWMVESNSFFLLKGREQQLPRLKVDTSVGVSTNRYDALEPVDHDAGGEEELNVRHEHQVIIREVFPIL